MSWRCGFRILRDRFPQIDECIPFGDDALTAADRGAISNQHRLANVRGWADMFHRIYKGFGA